MQYLFVLFVVLPILEITLLIKVGGLIGLLPTVALVLGTAFLGGHYLRQQGLQTLFRINQRLNSGELPARELLEGVVIAVGGALLLTPGFITDAMGFFCVLPGTRHLLVSALLKRSIVTAMGSGMPGAQPSSQPSGDDSLHPKPHRPVTIDGEYRRED